MKAKKQTSDRVSRIAAKVLRRLDSDKEGTLCTYEELRALAGSCLAQDETKGKRAGGEEAEGGEAVNPDKLAKARDEWLQGGDRELTHESGRDIDGPFHKICLIETTPGEPINGNASEDIEMVAKSHGVTYFEALEDALGQVGAFGGQG